MKEKWYLSLLLIAFAGATGLAEPNIVLQPADLAVWEGEVASFTVDAYSMSGTGLSYEWFKTADRAADTPGDDVSVGLGAELAIGAAAGSDEGHYFVAVSDADATVNSSVATLGVKRQVAYWTLDRADYVGGMYIDRVGGHDADPNFFGADAVSFVAGADASTGEAVDFGAAPITAGRVAPWSPALGTGEVTVSAWVKWAGPGTSAWQGLVESRGAPVDPEGDVRNFLWEIQPDDYVLRTNVGGIVTFAEALPVGEWSHVAFSVGPVSHTVWINGVPVGVTAPGLSAPQEVVHMYVGALARNEAGPTNPFNGAMDDVAVFNYAMSTGEIIDEFYYPISGAPACVDTSLAVLDVAGGGVLGDKPDCRITLADYAAFVQSWLECGLYPMAACQ